MPTLAGAAAGLPASSGLPPLAAWRRPSNAIAASALFKASAVLGEPRHAERQARVEVARAGQPVEGHAGAAERLVERLRSPGRVVEAEQPGVDAARAQRGEEGQEVALGATDATDPVDVDGPHAAAPRSRRSRRACTRWRIATAARIASRKSNGVR